MRQEQRIPELLQHYMDNTSTPEELQELDELFSNPANEEMLKDLLQHAYHSLKKESAGQFAGIAAKERIFRYITQQQQKSIDVKPTRRLWPRIAIAASVALAVITGGYFYYQTKTLNQPSELVNTNDIKPGGHKAYLTLANGQKISLTDAVKGNLATQAGMIITKTEDGQLVYTIADENKQISPSGTDAEGKESYNTIETPNGGQYQVRLPDGTAVWLNAASRLKYPTRFTANRERRVELSGEGYFQVARDKTKPFIVSASKQEVEVLGTHFNINAYPDENNIKTTLLEGSVSVGNVGRKAKILKPGEQSVNTGGNMEVTQVNTAYAVAWKDGYFRFNNKTLEMGLREVARWYNVEITYKKESLKSEPLAGRISKYDNIQQVLQKMELAGIVKFTIRGRQIIVE